MGTTVPTSSFALLCVFLLCEPSLQTEKHSLYYIYTAFSKPVERPGIYQFTAMGLLDDREIDYYNSEGQRKIPKQHWMKEKMQEDYWEKGTQFRKSKEQWFNVNVDILMKRMRHNESDVHVLQWRVGCEIEKQGDEVRFSRGINEYSYDGYNFLFFDDKESQWVAPVDAALLTKRRWDNVPVLNQYTKGYLEKECVDWLNKFREYGDEELRNCSPPDVHVIAKSCTSCKTKLKLTCFATGFYPKDVMVTIRKYRSHLPEEEILSSGVRPNHDGTFQLKKSVIIQEDEDAEYDCFVFHRTLKEPIIIPWDFTELTTFSKLSSRHTLQLEDGPVDMTVAEDDVGPDLTELSRPSSLLPPQWRSAIPTLSTISQSDISTPPLASQRLNTQKTHSSVQALISEAQPIIQKRRRSNDPTATEKQLLDILTQPATIPSLYIPIHGDEMYYFAISLVPRLSRLLPRNQTKAQISILTYLSDLEAEEQTLQQSHTSTQPFTSSQQPNSSGFHQYQPTPTYHQSHTHQIQTHNLAQSTPSSTRSGQQQGTSMEDPSSPVYHHFFNK